VDTPSHTPRYITDENGERVAVILPIAEYEEIADLLDDLEDTAEIERRRAQRNIPHDVAMRLVKDGGDIPD